MNATGQAADATLRAQGARNDACLAFAVTALVLYLAALKLPLATAAKFSEGHTSYLFSGVAGLWQSGNWHLAVIVLVCGAVAPMFLAGSLCVLLIASRRQRPGRMLLPWLHLAARVEAWSMPEVQMLAVIVAFMKLSTLVEAEPNAGLWCYGVAAFFTLLAWRRFDAAAIAAVLVPHGKEAAG